ncbi:MAG: hypothetical protein KGJ05_05495 [Alphaproteobacteria bacterium]|nr:hypothetical protein [Alphaproteobacteria bacterium]MDE2340733.1 hypothetical protein [Alphaproteobacteria bacterium]
MKYDLSRLSRLPLAYWVAGFFGLAVSILVVGAPHWIINSAVRQTGIGWAIPFFHPPLGTRRVLLLALLVGGTTAGGIVAVQQLKQKLFRPKLPAFSRNTLYPKPNSEKNAETEVLGTIASGRKPIFADRELGAPLMSDAALEQGQKIGIVMPDDHGSETAGAFEYPPEVKAFPLSAQPISEPEIDAGQLVPAANDSFESIDERASETVSSLLPSPPAQSVTEHRAPDMHSIEDMIVRLEAGLKTLGSHPPEPPQPNMEAIPPTSSAVPAAPILSVVPAPVSKPTDIAAQADDAMLKQAMYTLSRLVGGAR